MPKVSVLIPSYNHAAYLPQCLESVLAQTWEDWEAIVVDDVSPDDSFEVALGYSDPRIKASRNDQNLGTYATQNRCLELAQGEYVAVLNSDDYWKPGKLAGQMELLAKHPEATFAYAFGSLTDDQGNEALEDEQHGDLPRSEVQDLLPYLAFENRVIASSVLFKRGALRFEDTLRYSGDWVALLGLAQTGKAVFVPEPLVVWRQHPQNSHRQRLKHLGEEIRLRKSILGKADAWIASAADGELMRSKLALCAISLHTAYLIVGDKPKAAQALKAALNIQPANSQAKKRKALSWLPLGVQRSKVFPGGNCAEFEEAYKNWDLAELPLDPANVA